MFEPQGIETVKGLQGMLDGQAKRAVLREALAVMRPVGPKTLDTLTS